MSRIILASELQGRTLSELWSLYAIVERQVTQSPVNSSERRNSLASLENIRRAIGAHIRNPGGPARGP